MTVYYVITEKWDILKRTNSLKEIEKYIKDHPNIFQVICREETKKNLGPFHVYYSKN